MCGGGTYCCWPAMGGSNPASCLISQPEGKQMIKTMPTSQSASLRAAQSGLPSSDSCTLSLPSRPEPIDLSPSNLQSCLRPDEKEHTADRALVDVLQRARGGWSAQDEKAKHPQQKLPSPSQPHRPSSLPPNPKRNVEATHRAREREERYAEGREPRPALCLLDGGVVALCADARGVVAVLGRDAGLAAEAGRESRETVSTANQSSENTIVLTGLECTL